MAKRKPSPRKKTGTSMSYRSSLTKQLAFLAEAHGIAEVRAFIGSDEFIQGLAHMSDYDRNVTHDAVRKHLHNLEPPLPPSRPNEARRKWSDDDVAKLREIAARYGLRPGLDKELARQLQRPLMAVTLARYTYIGRVRAAQSTRKPRRTGTHGGREHFPVS